MNKGKALFSVHQIRSWRLYRGFDQATLGRLIGKTGQLISRVENRKIAFTQPLLDDLSRVLQVSRGAILDEEPPDETISNDRTVPDTERLRTKFSRTPGNPRRRAMPDLGSPAWYGRLCALPRRAGGRWPTDRDAIRHALMQSRSLASDTLIEMCR
jgi:transcriptional regulator with XRE-family HTH domain